MKEAKENSKPAIFFLGAGASVSGGIPLANTIVKDILEKYSHSPKIKKLDDNQKTYAKLMACLTPSQRNNLLKDYIDQAKINVTHIYLAQLINAGYVDYVFTVNFDNLMLRALALFNAFPPTHDMAILKDLTTSKFKEKSIVYLHGQHHGLWLLNTEDEINKAKPQIQRVFDSLKVDRPWVFLGYSGSDPVFDHIIDMGRFDDGLYWVGYKNHDLNSNVTNFLEKPNTNASLIQGYDADAFMIKLNKELGLPQPQIFDKPFSSLQTMLNDIVDIDDDEHFKGVKERLEMSKSHVQSAIEQFETNPNSEEALQKEIIDIILSENYDADKIELLTHKVNKNHNQDSLNLLSMLYSSWGTMLAKTKQDYEVDTLFQQIFNKYQKAIDIKPDNYQTFYNWGTALVDLALTKQGDEADELIRKACFKYQTATNIKSDCHEAFHNWGSALFHLANSKQSIKNDKIYEDVFVKYKKTIEIKPDKQETFFNWGNALVSLANRKKGNEADRIFQDAFDKYQKALNIKPDDYEVLYNWASALADSAKTKKELQADKVFHDAFDKYQKAVDIKTDFHDAYNNWGIDLASLARTKKENEASRFFEDACTKYQKATEIKPDKHNAFYNWGSTLADLARIKQGDEAYKLYLNSCSKYQKAFEIKADDHKSLNNWVASLLASFHLKSNDAISKKIDLAFETAKRAVDLGGDSYNLACCYAFKKDKANALTYLETSLQNKETSIEHIKSDLDWQTYQTDADFLALLEKYTE